MDRRGKDRSGNKNSKSFEILSDWKGGGGFSVRSNFKGCHVFVTLAYTYAFKKFFFRYFFASTDIYNLRIRILMNGITLEKLDPDLLEACLSVVYYAIS